jgi:hypothetical protein
MHLWLRFLVYLHESENDQCIFENNKKEKMSKNSKATIMFIAYT